jgi:hypothetical protein
MGDCPKCAQPLIGQFGCDDDELEVLLHCIGCSYETIRYFHWPEGLPDIELHSYPKPE